VSHVGYLQRLHNLMFVGPYIVIYFYSKTNQMNNISNLFYFGTTLYCLRLYIQHQVYGIQVLWLLTSGNEMELREFHHIPDAVCTVLDS